MKFGWVILFISFLLEIYEKELYLKLRLYLFIKKIVGLSYFVDN